MSEASENEFMNIAHQAIEDAGGVKCSKEEYSDGLDIIVAEIAVSQEAVQQELKEEEGKALAEPDEDAGPQPGGQSPESDEDDDDDDDDDEEEGD